MDSGLGESYGSLGMFNCLPGTMLMFAASARIRRTGGEANVRQVSKHNVWTSRLFWLIGLAMIVLGVFTVWCGLGMIDDLFLSGAVIIIVGIFLFLTGGTSARLHSMKREYTEGRKALENFERLLRLCAAPQTSKKGEAKG
jgi:hypothetical protein